MANRFINDAGCEEPDYRLSMKHSRAAYVIMRQLVCGRPPRDAGRGEPAPPSGLIRTLSGPHVATACLRVSFQ
jgi:hypothetical protein